MKSKCRSIVEKRFTCNIISCRWSTCILIWINLMQMENSNTEILLFVIGIGESVQLTYGEFVVDDLNTMHPWQIENKQGKLMLYSNNAFNMIYSGCPMWISLFQFVSYYKSRGVTDTVKLVYCRRRFVEYRCIGLGITNIWCRTNSYRYHF